MELVGKKLSEKSGQTVIEYLLLLSAAFITGYIVITGPVASYTAQWLTHIRGGVQNTVRNGEWREGEVQAGERGHPADAKRFRALHL